MANKVKSIMSLVSYFKTFYGSTKPIKFLEKQSKDIKIFGKMHYRDNNVSPETIEKFTPFRRLSKKKCQLSDPKYFIERFEKENINEIPNRWHKMRDEEKVDFIVKNRYEKLVSNKIMNNIKDSRIEEAFGITTDGQIRYHSTCYSSRHCPNANDKNLISIHNHPKQFGSAYSSTEYARINKDFHPFSQSDIINSIKRPKSYVVDMHGNKYCLIPNKKLQNTYTVDDYIKDLSEDLSNITRTNLNKYSTISDAIKYSRLDYIKRIKLDNHYFKNLNLFDN